MRNVRACFASDQRERTCFWCVITRPRQAWHTLQLLQLGKGAGDHDEGPDVMVVGFPVVLL